MPWDRDCEYALEKCPSYKEKKCDVTKIQICGIMGLANIYRKNKMEKAPLPKISLLVQIGQECTGSQWWLHTNPSTDGLDLNDPGLFSKGLYGVIGA